MSTAVVITVAGRDQHLRRTLAGLAEQRVAPSQIVVVDMADASAVLADAPSQVQHVPLRVEGVVLPLARARNLGARSANADRLVFLDVDCIAHHDLVADYERALDLHPDGLACGAVRYLAPRWEDEAEGVLDELSAPHPARVALPPGTTRRDPDGHELFWSLNFAVTTSVWSVLGGFDESYEGYGAEDTDLAYRARAAGIPIVWLGGATAYHQWHPPTRLRPERVAEIVSNAQRFQRRWGIWPMRGWLAELEAEGLVRFDPSRRDSQALSLR